MQIISNKKQPATDALLYVNAQVTRDNYRRKLELFFEYIEIEGEDLDAQGQAFLDQARGGQDPEWAQHQIMRFMDYQKQRCLVKKELSASTLKNFYKPIKFFCAIHRDIQNNIDWQLVKRALPKSKQYSNDRAPTLDEIRKLSEYPDRRIKPIVLTMCSSGIRVGAWEFMQWKHITPLYDPKNPDLVIAAKLVVYAGEPEEYQTFMTPEAYHALKGWMDFRASYGEQITGDSWVMRNIWRTTDVKRGMKKHTDKNDNFYARAIAPERLSVDSIKRILIRALSEQGIRADLAQGVRRHEFKGAHSYRKYYKTRAEQVMNRLNVEFLLGHTIGINSNYYRPTFDELLKDYLKAVPSLTISDSTNTDRILQQEKEVEDTKKQIEMMAEEQARMREMLRTTCLTAASMIKMFTSIDHDTRTMPADKYKKMLTDALKMLDAFDVGASGKQEEEVK